MVDHTLTAKEIKAQVDAAINNVTVQLEKVPKLDLADAQALYNRMDAISSGYPGETLPGGVNMDQLSRNISSEQHKIEDIEKHGSSARLKAERIVLGSHVTDPKAVAILIEQTAIEYKAGIGAFKVAQADENKLQSPSAGGKKGTGHHIE